MAEEKSKTTLLKEKIMMTEPKGVKALSEEEIKKADSFCDGYKKFLDNSPVEREAVRYTVELAKKAGFAEYEQDKEYKAGDRLYYVNRDKAVALAVIGKNGVKNGARLAIAHIDSPRVDLKPNPLFEANNLAFFKTHYYGGLKKYQWTTIPLSLHGAVVKKDGETVTVKIGEDEGDPVFCVTDLLIHLSQEQLTKEIEDMTQRRLQFFTNVSHELRTPLTAVRGLLEPLSDGMVKDAETQKRYYDIMMHEVLRMSRLITDLLQLSRLQSGSEYMEVSAVNLQELLEEMQQNYKVEAAQHGIRLELKAENVPYAMTDRDRVEQILVILIDNAMRYTPEGGSITLSAEAGERIVVSVTDTGCGIAAEELPHLFERFYKVDKSRKEGGTGLGLSIAKQIIDNLGEQITVQSVVGKGTSFHFTLKRYVSNAIALGPSSPGVVYSEDVGLQNQNDVLTGQQDAPYEIIEPKAEKHTKQSKVEKKRKRG